VGGYLEKDERKHYEESGRPKTIYGVMLKESINI
jgi:hypothetical protein